MMPSDTGPSKDHAQPWCDERPAVADPSPERKLTIIWDHEKQALLERIEELERKVSEIFNILELRFLEGHPERHPTAEVFPPLPDPPRD